MNVKDFANQAQLLPKKALQRSKYRVLALVGQGQFGRVFCAVDRQTGQLVALKELSHQRLPTNKFLRELWSLMTLQHPNLVTCQAVEQTANARYLVMDYCEGGTLRYLLEQPNALPLEEGLTLMIGVLAGLEHAHRQGIIHCDIKPENILLTLSGGVWWPRLSDFGIARKLSDLARDRATNAASDRLETFGAPAYMAPEASYGRYVAASDIYSMGIILFELLMGYRPFSGTPMQLMWAHLNKPLQVPPGLPMVLQQLLQKALAKLPARRFASADQMAVAIQAALDDPEVRRSRDRILPWQDRPDPIVLNLTSTPKPEILSAPLRNLVIGNGAVVGAAATSVTIWQNPPTHQISFTFPQTLTDVLPAGSGCVAMTASHVYAIAPVFWQTHLPDLNVDPELNRQSDSPPKRETCQWQVQTLLSIDHEFRASIDSQGRCLAIAQANQLDFYRLPKMNNTGWSDFKLTTPTRSFSLPSGKLPQLIFLDSRHLLAIWRENEQKRALLRMRIYTRRGGIWGGAVRIPATLAQVRATSQPDTLFGIEPSSRPAALQIQLRPFQVMRIPLKTLPVCWAEVSGGYVLADAKGEIRLLDHQGQLLGILSGPPAPTAIAPWGNKGLAVATHDEKGSHFYCLELNV